MVRHSWSAIRRLPFIVRHWNVPVPVHEAGFARTVVCEDCPEMAALQNDCVHRPGLQAGWSASPSREDGVQNDRVR